MRGLYNELKIASTSAYILMNLTPHSTHNKSDIAYHFDWEFRNEAVFGDAEKPVGINFHPLATELHQWLLQKGNLSVFAQNHQYTKYSITNPYTYNASLIAAILARVLNDIDEFSGNESFPDKMDADIERIRLYNEQTLYTVRFCEASIKQLLYCTQIPEKLYKTAPLLRLLSTECLECKKSSKTKHQISMIGSLAHRYQLCLEFDNCLIEHLKIINRRRNAEASHSGTQPLIIRTSRESKCQLKTDSTEAGNELVHMLKHISDLENKMTSELVSRLFQVETSHNFGEIFRSQ